MSAPIEFDHEGKRFRLCLMRWSSGASGSGWICYGGELQEEHLIAALQGMETEDVDRILRHLPEHTVQQSVAEQRAYERGLQDGCASWEALCRWSLTVKGEGGGFMPTNDAPPELAVSSYGYVLESGKHGTTFTRAATALCEKLGLKRADPQVSDRVLPPAAAQVVGYWEGNRMATCSYESPYPSEFALMHDAPEHPLSDSAQIKSGSTIERLPHELRSSGAWEAALGIAKSRDLLLVRCIWPTHEQVQIAIDFAKKVSG